MVKSILLFISTLLLIHINVNAADTMPCDPNGQCSDECMYFPGGVAFALTNDGAKLQYDGVVHSLKLIKKKVLRKRQLDANLVGDMDVRIFEAKNIRVEVTNTIKESSCFVKNANGKYEETDSDCGGRNDVVLKVIDAAGTKEYKTTWDWGC